MDHRHAKGARMPGGADLFWLVIKEYLPAIWLVHAAQHLHERAFSSAVLTNQGMDLASVQIESYLDQSLHTWETLADILHYQKRGFILHGDFPGKYA
jgi:uncharacterized membrane protein YphA (DoxX/SURF4 family)